MLKWAVSSSKRGGDPQHHHHHHQQQQESKGIVKSKISRRRGGSIGRRKGRGVRKVVLHDKENVANFMAGCTPCHHPSKDPLVQLRKFDSPLRDVSNVTPKTPGSNRYHQNRRQRRTSDENPPIRTPKNADKRRRIRKRRILAESSEDEGIEVIRSSVIHAASAPTFEIEYSSRQKLVGRESTLPVFVDNPLYFKPDEKVDRIDAAVLWNHHHHKRKFTSEVSPLAKKLASLCFSRPSSVDSPPLTARDDEISAEMETKLLREDASTSSPSSISDSKMGDATLDRMIDDIIESGRKARPQERDEQWKRWSSRRCLTFSPEVELKVTQGADALTVHIVRCCNLRRRDGADTVNAYVKVCSRGIGLCQRTPVRRGCGDPQFDHLMTFPPTDDTLQVSVWHRDTAHSRSELLGCAGLPPAECAAGLRLRLTMAGQELSSDQATAADHVKLAQQQREADEHLFLRYLELDPVEGPDAAPAAVQRKASGNKAGRTPFTTTRRLERRPEQGFGFSVVWTRPPRIERVEAGKAAERAGLLPGDYVVFVDRQNVVTMPEAQVLNLIKSSGTSLILETFRRSAQQPPGGHPVHPGRGSIASHVTISEAPCSPRTAPPGRAPSAKSFGAEPTPPRRRPVALPQLAFTRESGSGATNLGASGAGEHVRALHAVVLREQQYTAWMQFGIERFVVPLASRSDVISPSEHKLLFQNCEELLRLSEDILEQIVTEDGEVQLHLIASVYLARLHSIISLYKTYCNGLKRADCVLVQRSRQQGGNFVKLCTEPPIPRRRPDVTQFIHKPLEQFRELLRLLRAARAIVPASHADHPALAKLVNELQNAYHEITAGAGLMGPLGEGRPLLSVADLESRLVFTRCKPFTLAKPGRQWIFGGDLARVEGRAVRPYWALLFSDLLLFATVSRDRVLFITEEPLPIANITETCFNVRKKANEFRLAVGAGRANSPTARCGPPVRARARTIVLRAPSSDLKAVWQSLLLRQICRVNSSSGTPLSSPMESPAVPLGCYSEVTLDSQQRQVSFASLGSRSRQLINTSGNQSDLHQQLQHHRHHSVSFASVGGAGSMSKLSNNRSTIDEEYVDRLAMTSLEMLSDRMNSSDDHQLDNNNGYYLTPAQTGGVAKTPDTPPPNISPGDSSKNSQTFSSHFVSMESSLEKGATSDDNYSLQRKHNSGTPSSPSAILTPSTDFCPGGEGGGQQHQNFGEEYGNDDDPELWDSDGLCKWESFEADLALAGLNLDPCFKMDVEENIYFRDDFFSVRRMSKVQGRMHPSRTLDL